MTTRMKCLEGNEPRILATQEFIERNNLRIIPQKEIKTLFEEDNDMFGFAKEVYLEHMAWDEAKQHYNDEYVKSVEDGAEPNTQVTDVMEAAQDFLDYMVFAWMKAEDERGISASRSIVKLSAWLKVLGRNDLSELIESEGLYNPYGAPALIAVCKEMEIPTPQSLHEFAGV